VIKRDKEALGLIKNLVIVVPGFIDNLPIFELQDHHYGLGHLYELNELNQITGWVVEPDPPGAGILFDLPRQLDMLSFEALYGIINIFDGKGYQREVRWDRPLGSHRLSLEDSQVYVADFKMRAVVVG